MIKILDIIFQQKDVFEKIFQNMSLNEFLLSLPNEESLDYCLDIMFENESILKKINKNQINYMFFPTDKAQKIACAIVNCFKNHRFRMEIISTIQNNHVFYYQTFLISKNKHIYDILNATGNISHQRHFEEFLKKNPTKEQIQDVTIFSPYIVLTNEQISTEEKEDIVLQNMKNRPSVIDLTTKEAEYLFGNKILNIQSLDKIIKLQKEFKNENLKEILLSTIKNIIAYIKADCKKNEKNSIFIDFPESIDEDTLSFMLENKIEVWFDLSRLGEKISDEKKEIWIQQKMDIIKNDKNRFVSFFKKNIDFIKSPVFRETIANKFMELFSDDKLVCVGINMEEYDCNLINDLKNTDPEHKIDVFKKIVNCEALRFDVNGEKITAFPYILQKTLCDKKILIEKIENYKKENFPETINIINYPLHLLAIFSALNMFQLTCSRNFSQTQKYF